VTFKRRNATDTLSTALVALSPDTSSDILLRRTERLGLGVGRVTCEVPLPLRSHFNSENRYKESVLLRSIRSALRGSNLDPNLQHATFYDTSSDNEPEGGAEELLWDEKRVVLCAGGVIQKQWSFTTRDNLFSGPALAGFNSLALLLRHDPQVTTQMTPLWALSVNAKVALEPLLDHLIRRNKSVGVRLNQSPNVRAIFVFLRSVGWIIPQQWYRVHIFPTLHRAQSMASVPTWSDYPRVLEPTEVQEAELTGDETLPTVFSLISPLAEATVVDHAANIIGGFHSVPLTLVHDDDDDSDHISEPLSAGEVIVWVSCQGHGEDSDLLVTVHP